MSIPGAANPLFLSTAGGAAAGYAINRSLRFNPADSAHLNRTPASAGSQTTWTWSAWVKRSNLDNSKRQALFSAYSGNSDSGTFEFGYSNSVEDGQTTSKLYWAQYNQSGYTAAVFRDPSAWYHVVITLSSGTISIYVNNTQQTLSNSSTSGTVIVNSNVFHAIGRHGTSIRYFDGFLADIQFIDGQALAATDFGELDDSKVWQPKKFAGTYGTNGFHLDFSDGADLGNDSSGANNDWTPNNLVGELGTGDFGMDAVAYSGTGSTRSISSLKFQPDFLWFKQRSGGEWHYLFDSIRGTSKALFSNTTNGDYTVGANVGLSFNSNGFSVGSDSAVNGSGSTYVAWAFKAGGAAVSNTDGTITSQVSANQAHGFSICTFTGTGGNTEVGHGLSTAPQFVMAKTRTKADGWPVYHAGGGSNYQFFINQNDAGASGTSYFNGAPTSSVVKLGNNSGSNQSGQPCLLYCWSEVAGYSKIGSVGAGSDPIVTTGFKPRFVMVKRSDSGGNWNIFDTARGGGTTQIWLEANSGGAENNHVNGQFKFLDNGFQLIGPDIDVGTVIYMAYCRRR